MQIVGYDAGVAELRYDPAEGTLGTIHPASLLIANEGNVQTHRLADDEELDFVLGTRYCAGETDGDTHHPCSTETGPYCDDHRDRWPCARCTGECDKPIPACDAEHAVYLAAFAPDIVKVGVTRLRRLYARLREQGADRAAHIHSVSDGRIARRIEREIARNRPDRVPVRRKIEGLTHTVDESLWTRLLADYSVIETFDFAYGLDLSERPMAETIAAGTVRGTKGRLLILDRPSGSYAVDLRDLVGYEVRVGGTDRDLQSSLRTFEERQPF